MSATTPTIPDATAIPDVPEAADKAQAPEPAASQGAALFRFVRGAALLPRGEVK